MDRLRERKAESLPSLQPGQGVFYLERGDGGFSIRSAVYVGEIIDDERRPRAALSLHAVTDPQETLIAYRKVAAPTAEDHREELQGTIQAEKPEGVLDVDSKTVQRLNPSRESIIASVRVSRDALQAQQHGIEDPLSSLREHEQAYSRAITDMLAGRMTLEAYGILEGSAMRQIRLAYTDLDRDMPTQADRNGWEYAVMCVNDLQRALNKVRGDFMQFSQQQADRQQELIQNQARSARDSFELALISGGLEQLRAQGAALIERHRSARNRVISTLGILLQINDWYHQSNPKK